MELSEFFMPIKKAAVLHLGNIASDYLIYAAAACGIKAKAYYVETSSFTGEALQYALVVAKTLGIETAVLPMNEETQGDDHERIVLSRFKESAEHEGYSVFLESSGAAQRDEDQRICLLKEMGIMLPFRECGIHDTEILRRAGNAGFRVV